MPRQTQGVDRRSFVKAAVAIGGAAALSACAQRETGETPEANGSTATHPQGATDPDSLPRRQHEWNTSLVHDPHGNTVLPRHQVMLLLDYAGEGTPSDDDRAQVEAALGSLERAFQHGTGDDPGASFSRGLLFMLGYAPAYFDRFDESLPESAGMLTPESVIDQLDEDATADAYDAVLVITSDFGSILLEAEEALFGRREQANGAAMEADFEGVFELAERRTGVAGRGLPAERLENDDVPEEAPLSMGYKSGFRDNQAGEDAVTIQDGPFAGGTTLLSSRLGMHLDEWYDNDAETRTKLMFSPDHTTEEVGGTGERLGDNSEVTEETVDDIDDHAAEHGCIGHAQKVARARDDEFEPRILRRTEGVATGPNGAGFNFNSVQRTMSAFVETRKAMDERVDGVDRDCDGIGSYHSVQRRGTYLVPPRERRAFPTPRPDSDR